MRAFSKYSILTKVVPTLFGNSLAIIAKDAVKNAALPRASTILIMKASVMNKVWP